MEQDKRKKRFTKKGKIDNKPKIKKEYNKENIKKIYNKLEVPVPLPNTEELIKRKESQAEAISILITKHKKLIGKGYKLTNFKEPVMFLIRRNNRVDFYENVTEGKFKYNHTDEDIGELSVELTSSQLLRFPYGNNEFRGYIHYEDEYQTYPQKPLLNAELVGIQMTKILNDIKKWKADELRARGDLFRSIFVGLAIVILAYAIYRMLAPQDNSGNAERIVVNQGSKVVGDAIGNHTSLFT